MVDVWLADGLQLSLGPRQKGSCSQNKIANISVNYNKYNKFTNQLPNYSGHFLFVTFPYPTKNQPPVNLPGVLPSLKRTAKAPENRPGPKRKVVSNHQFSGTMLVSGRVRVMKSLCFFFKHPRRKQGLQLLQQMPLSTVQLLGLEID